MLCLLVLEVLSSPCPLRDKKGQRAWRECLEEDFCSSLTSELQVFGGLLSGCMRCTRARLPIWRVLGCSEMWRAGLITSVSEAVGMCTVARCRASVIDSWAFCCSASIWSALVP